MTKRTHIIGNTSMHVIKEQPTFSDHIILTQSQDIVVLTIDEAREIAAVISEV